ncbi:hypothetical protein CH333_01645 [candidate division WOR-3 bacterium JGI_Cruoil_03_44_89]|uniref:Secretion system C-terminal sorting domain-containing protein n=1 Tax=candidate division WOR-3 bacterium JGI_Cruoil_03_44_89 TaxID=1973748 RepID=A0A235BY54_UNCW3|nr:MAG: hypothetical protein CH333_01645 [candidate division WOR-3 bacterium JGI_Cruoil_03_44_89]
MSYFLSLLVSLIIAQGAITGNILPNPSLEEWHDTLGVMMPVGWFTSEAYSAGTALRSDHAHTGNYAIELVTLNENDVGCLQGNALIQGGKLCNLSAYYDCSSFSAFGIIYLFEISESDTQMTIEYCFAFISGYTHFDTNFTTDENTIKVVISCVNINWGEPGLKVYFDDISLNEIEGIEESERLQSPKVEILKVYPNPFSKKVSIRCVRNKWQKISLQIYDLSGRLVGKTDKGVWNGRDINGKEVQSGIYFLRAKGYKPVKVVKLR